MRTLAIGDKIRLTGQFLRNTGQTRGGEGRKTWLVVSCDCELCKRDHVAVNETSSFAEAPRHLNRANVSRVGTLDSRNAL